MMNKYVKRKWVKALRSGEYEQTRQSLFDYYNEEDGAGYCCLAVLLAEARPNAFSDVIHTPWGGQDVEVDERDAGGRISDDLAILWGLDDDAQDTLTALNDDRNYTFPQIADWIEENL